MEEEIIRATGSGCNPNAAALDPEKMELHRIDRGILTLADTAVHPFTELKSRQVELLTPSILDKSTGILWGAELVGRRPTGGDDGGPAA